MSTLRSAAFALLLSLCTLIPEAHAQFTAMKQIESSLLVTGTVDVDASGRVLGYAVDEPEKLPQAILSMTARIAPQWRFEAAEGVPTQRLAMRLMFVSKKLDDTRYEITLRSGNFEKSGLGPASHLRVDPDHFVAPRYPALWEQAGVTGQIFVALRIDRDGRPPDFAVTRINMRAITSQPKLQRLRTAAAKSVLAEAPNWRFLLPVEELATDKQSWTGTLPISYWFEGQEPRYGTWMPYVAGPYTPAPWAEEDAKSADQSQEALPSGAFHSTTDSRRLISPLQGG